MKRSGLIFILVLFFTALSGIKVQAQDSTARGEVYIWNFEKKEFLKSENIFQNNPKEIHFAFQGFVVKGIVSGFQKNSAAKDSLVGAMNNLARDSIFVSMVQRYRIGRIYFKLSPSLVKMRVGVSTVSLWGCSGPRDFVEVSFVITDPKLSGTRVFTGQVDRIFVKSKKSLQKQFQKLKKEKLTPREPFKET